MQGEEIMLATQNTQSLGQGFNGKKKRKEIQSFFKNTTPRTDVLLLQETKLPEEACLKQARFLEFKGGSSLWNEASFSALSGKFTGGTGIILSERMAAITTHHGILFPGRAQYVVLNLSQRLQLGIINIYGFSETGPRAMLWNHIAQTPLPEAEWVLAGDFNNIESIQDKQGGSDKTSIGNREMEAWNKLLVRLGVRDAYHIRAFRRKTTKAFTWTNGRNDETMVQSRIDRIYVPPRLATAGGTTEILPEIPDISDHSGVLMHFNNSGPRKSKHPSFNLGLLKHPESKEALVKTWREVMDDETLDSWNAKVVAANKAILAKSAELTKQQKKQWKATYLEQFDDIVAAEDELQHNWGSTEARDRLSDAQAKLHEVRQQKFQFKESAILSKWARVGDRCTKEFFEHFSGQRRQVTIKSLLEGETLLTSQAELERHILSFYEALYSLDAQVENNIAARLDCLQYIKTTVTAEHNEELLKPLTQEEVKEAVNQLSVGKAPGVDSIPAEFYQEVWEDIEFDIFSFVLESVDLEGIADELNISKIALLPKSEDRLRIQNYRPISLLNTLYKVVAKIYANRMKPLIHHWILPSQTGFVPNRCILDNVFLAFEAIEWTLENKQDLSMLLLDFEKAYDRVNWTFLRETMEIMGFSNKWVNQVMSLNMNASAAVIVNGEQSQTFHLRRSVRQGCPLAPYLFLLTVDVLGQMLQHPDCGVQGLKLPDHTSITNQMFADDTLLLLDGTKDNMDRALAVIDRFGAASGAKLNLHKSVGLWLSSTDRTWQWGEATGFKWLQPGEITRYLGFPFGLRIPQKEKDNKMLTQLRKHLFKWADQKLSLAGRIMIANQVILSSIWYLASCTDLSSKALKLARALVRNYVWSGQRESNSRARVKWDTAVLPVVRGGIKILDPQWQTSALLIKLLIRGLSVGYEPWKALVRYRVAQTKQSRNGNWPAHANWIMNSRPLVKHGSTMWQGVMKAWSTIQAGLEQQDPNSWSEIIRQPLYGNRMLTNEVGIQWGTEPRTTMLWWPQRNLRSLQDLIRPDGYGWKGFEESSLRRTRVTPGLYSRLRASIPWSATPAPAPYRGQWLAPKAANGSITQILQVTSVDPLHATLYIKDATERLHLAERNFRPLDEQLQEVRVVECGGARRTILNLNPTKEVDPEHTLWLWGNEWIRNLEWDPKEWHWRRIGILPETFVLNYTTKRGYRAALKQNNHIMPVDAELAAEGYNSKARAKFFNRIWHPYLPRKVSAMQWLILTEGLPVGAWREKLGLSNECQLCEEHPRETLQHAFQTCPEISRVWDLFRDLRHRAGLSPAYHSWKDISRGLLTDPPGPCIEEDLRWDTAAAFKVTMDTPWDVLRAQILWAIWC
jgi:exonuclease III